MEEHFSLPSADVLTQTCQNHQLISCVHIHAFQQPSLVSRTYITLQCDQETTLCTTYEPNTLAALEISFNTPANLQLLAIGNAPIYLHIYRKTILPSRHINAIILVFH